MIFDFILAFWTRLCLYLMGLGSSAIAVARWSVTGGFAAVEQNFDVRVDTEGWGEQRCTIRFTIPSLWS